LRPASADWHREMSPLLTGLFDRLMARRPHDFRPESILFGEGRREDDEQRRQERTACSERALVEWLDESDERRAEIAWICDRSADGLGVQSPFRLEPGWPVLVTFSNEAPVKAMVRHCKAEREDFRSGLKIIRHERRRHDRSLARGHATVTWESGGVGERRTRARILDVSEGGVGLSGEAPIPEQTAVCIVHDGWQRFGSVTHGRTEGERYVFGVQFAGPPRPVGGPEFRD